MSRETREYLCRNGIHLCLLLTSLFAIILELVKASVINLVRNLAREGLAD